MHCSRSHNAVIRVHDDVGNVIETQEHKGDFKEWLVSFVCVGRSPAKMTARI
jgi:hypothetical protein